MDLIRICIFGVVSHPYPLTLRSLLQRRVTGSARIVEAGAVYFLVFFNARISFRMDLIQIWPFGGVSHPHPRSLRSLLQSRVTGSTRTVDVGFDPFFWMDLIQIRPFGGVSQPHPSSLRSRSEPLILMNLIRIRPFVVSLTQIRFGI